MTSTLPIADPIEVYVDRRGNRSVLVRCPYCCKEHRHGIGREDLGRLLAGSRVAHCIGPTRVTRFYERPPHVSRSYFIPPGPLEALVAVHNTDQTEEQP